MRKLYLIRIITASIVLLASGNFSTAQCPAGSSTANLNWDNLDYLTQTGNYASFVTTAMMQSQKFTMGRNRLTINFPGTLTTNGENIANTAEVGSFGTGADVEYNGNGTIVITFDTVVYNLQFSLYDIDLSQTLQVTATDPVSGPLSINMTTLTPTNITVTGSGGSAPLATSSSIIAANSDTRATVNISIPGNLPGGAKGIKTVNITVGGTAGNFWLSDLSACVFGSFPLNYFASQKPWQGQPAYYLVTPDNNSVYMIDPLTGKSQWMFSEANSPWVNSLAYDPIHHIAYYVMDHSSPVITNTELKKYDFNTETSSTVIPDLRTFGIPLFDIAVESAGAAFYNGSLFLGVEGTNAAKTSNRKSIIWRIDFDAAQNPIQAAQVYAAQTDNGAGLLTHDWGDFTIKDGTLYDFNTGNSSTTASFIHFNMQTANTTVFPTGTNPSPIQAGQTWDGTIYWTGGQGVTETGRVAKYNENGTIGAKIVATVSACSPAWVGRAGDASDPFKPKSDFGDAPMSYDPVSDDKATHEYDCNLRLGATFDREWDKTPSANASADGSDEDGISVVSVLSAGVANFLQSVSVYNNTGAPATVVAWLDYNGNGTFDPVEGKSVTVPTSATTQNITLSWIGIPVSMTPGSFTFLRVRITSATNGMSISTPNKWFANGEVEDYRVPVDFVLPIKMLSFHAGYEGINKVSIDWSTGKETNLDGYIVERSKDGTQWNSVATVAGQSGNNTENNYQLYDNDPFAGKSYYRLQLQYTDGHKEYSEIRIVEWKTVNTWMKVTPNPVHDHTNIQFSLDRSETVSVDIISASGTQVMHKTISAVKGINQFSMNDCSRLSPGVYVIQMKTSFSVMSTKMIVE